MRTVTLTVTVTAHATTCTHASTAAGTYTLTSTPTSTPTSTYTPTSMPTSTSTSTSTPTPTRRVSAHVSGRAGAPAAAPAPPRTVWRSSSHSNAEGGNCVEVAHRPGTAGGAGAETVPDPVPVLVPVRDSKCPHGPSLRFGAAAWSSFVDALKASP